jgi:hypothetical protein
MRGKDVLGERILTSYDENGLVYGRRWKSRGRN